MLPYPLNEIEIQRYYQNKSKLKVVYSGNNLPKIVKDRLSVANSDEYKWTETLSVAFYVNDNATIYFHSLRVGHIPEEIK